MVAFNLTPTAPSDGILYASAVPLTSTEASLWGGTGAQGIDPIGTTFNEAISAVIQLTINGIVTAINTYVVLQMDMGDGVWIDINWLVWTGNQGSATFVFSNGIAGANSFQQIRSSGQPPTPQSNGSNQMTLGGRLRFVGKSTFAAGSSIAAGASSIITATIKYRLQPLR